MKKALLGLMAASSIATAQTPSPETKQVMTLAQKATAHLTRPKVATAGGWSGNDLNIAIK